MECTQTADGLSRMFRVVIPARDLQAQLDAKIAEVGPRVQLKGFRPGKVPTAHLKKIYGPSMLREIIDEEVQKSTQAAIQSADVRIASQPHLHLESDLDEVAEGKADLAFHFHVDVMPDFEPIDPGTLSLERIVAPVSEEQVEEALVSLAKANRDFVEKDAPAGEGDAVTIDFIGKIDGEPFEGGSAQGAVVMIGARQFIPGFEEQLVGVKSGEARTLNVSFPADYAVERLKGKAATFDVTVSSVKAPQETPLSDALAEKLGMKTLDEVRQALRQRLEAQHNEQSRLKTKRLLLDKLDAAHAFELPKTMVESEFAQIWEQIKADKEAGRLDPEDQSKSEEELENEYRAIAERRVRLGLVLAEIGRRNNIVVPEDEVARAVGMQAQRFPGQERQVVEFYQKNPSALAQIRAPLYEERVVDFILELANTKTRQVSREELFTDRSESD